MLKLILPEHYQKITILNIFEQHNMTPLSIRVFEEALGESRFKTNKLLTEVIEDVHLYSSGLIEINETNHYTAFQINTEVVNQFKLFYLKTSPLYRLFLFYFNSEKNLPLLTKDLAISTASTYSYISQLNNVLEPQKLQIKKKALQGDEQHLRFLTFELIQYYYKGIEAPFKQNHQKFINQVLLTLNKFFSRRLSHSNRLKLTHFLSVAGQRLQNGHGIDKLDTPPVSLRDLVANDRLVSSLLVAFKTTFPTISEHQLKNECALLLAFIYSENLAPHEWQLLAKQDDIVTLRHDFMSGVTDLLIEPISSTSVQTIEQELDRIFYKMLYFNYTSDSFDDTSAVQQFQELYPTVSKFITTFLAEQPVDHQTPNLYYDLLFNLTTNLSAEYFSHPIYICVDFSKGHLYNDYIKERILAFNTLRIVFQEFLSEETHLYLSDFANYQTDTPQIIWKNPPTVNDWNTLGNTIVTLKQEELD